jgi:hypothetical protein
MFIAMDGMYDCFASLQGRNSLEQRRSSCRGAKTVRMIDWLPHLYRREIPGEHRESCNGNRAASRETCIFLDPSITMSFCEIKRKELNVWGLYVNIFMLLPMNCLFMNVLFAGT